MRMSCAFARSQLQPSALPSPTTPSSAGACAFPPAPPNEKAASGACDAGEGEGDPATSGGGKGTAGKAIPLLLLLLLELLLQPTLCWNFCYWKLSPLCFELFEFAKRGGVASPTPLRAAMFLRRIDDDLTCSSGRGRGVGSKSESTHDTGLGISRGDAQTARNDHACDNCSYFFDSA